MLPSEKEEEALHFVLVSINYRVPYRKRIKGFRDLWALCDGLCLVDRGRKGDGDEGVREERN